MESLPYVLEHDILKYELDADATHPLIRDDLQSVNRNAFEATSARDVLANRQAFTGDHPVAWYCSLYNEFSKAVRKAAAIGKALRAPEARATFPKPMRNLLMELGSKFATGHEEVREEVNDEAFFELAATLVSSADGAHPQTIQLPPPARPKLTHDE